MKNVFVLLLIANLLFSCTTKNKFDVNVSNIKSKVNVKRFEQSFYTAKKNNLAKLRKEFAAIIPHQLSDSLLLSKIKNDDEMELYHAVQKVYPDFEDEKLQLENLFKHIKYYYPTFNEPEIITVIDNVQLDNKVSLHANKLYISLDVFLGNENSIYIDYPKYIKQNLTKKQLIVETAKLFANKAIFKSTNRTFMSRMVQKGKLYYALQAFLPNVLDAEIIGYNNEEMNWININQEMIWRFFIEKELLYSTNTKLDRRFLAEAPFSKFYLEVDQDSPGRVGEWIGWQIVKSYMKNNEVTLQELLKLDNEAIFKKSKYKPKS